MAADSELLVEKVLRAVELVPSGRVTTYGDIAAVIGTGPRQVGAVMARDGAAVAWWRVTNATGRLPVHLLGEAIEHWQAEGIELAPNGRGCRIAVHRLTEVELDDLAEAWHHTWTASDGAPTHAARH